MRRMTVVLGLAVLMAATVVLTAGAAVAQASFTAPQSFRTGDTAEAVVSADFKGDSKADLAVANNGSNSGLLSDNVSVLLGNGDGTYGTAQNFSVGDAPLHLTSADFNGDSKADLAVANIRSDNVSVLLGNGDGTFGAAQNFGGVDGPFSVSSADFNGDAKADLAVAYNGAFTIPGGVSVRLGNGDGTFGAAQNFVAGLHPTSVSSADFNGDSKVDLATANAGSDNVSVLLGKGDGTFGTAQNFGAGDTPVYLASEDFDGDSKVDLAVANNSSDNVSVLSGNGDGIFQTAQNFAAGTSPSSLVGGLFNNDSEADLAVTNEVFSGTVSILLNNTSTTPPETAPTVIPNGTVPTANATNVDRTTNIKATFSEDMMASSINGQTFKLFKKGSTTKISATVSYDPTTKTATLNPFGATTTRLARGTTYKAVVTAGAKDLAGNSLDQDPRLAGLQQKKWFFTTTT
jgi:Bacterial Ig-like domain/FG-GAP-like repeat